MNTETSRVFRIISAITEVALSMCGKRFKDLEMANTLTLSTLIIRGCRNRLNSGGIDASTTPLQIALSRLQKMADRTTLHRTSNSSKGTVMKTGCIQMIVPACVLIALGLN